jgi:hypothetical protein
MPNPFEEEPIPFEEEEQQPVQEPDNAPHDFSEPPVAINRNDIINAVEAEDLKGERAEKLLEPMELEETEAIPRRRGNFRTEALKQAFQESTIDPKEGISEGLEKTQEIAEKAGVSFLHHIPGIGLLVAYFAKRKVSSEIKETTEQFQTLNQARMKILTKQPRAALDISRGTDPTSFWESDPRKDVNLLLANTLEYAQLQLQKRDKKLQRNSFATDIQTLGAGVSTTMLAAPVGAGISAVGTVIKSFQGFKSIGNFFRKLYNRTLGVDRNQHAMLLYGLALEYQQFKQQKAPQRNIDEVNKSLEFVSRLGSIKDREQAREQAFQILKKLEVPIDFKRIRELLKS